MDVLAVNNFGDTRSGGLAGPMGLLVIALMCIATVLLIRNMNSRLRRLPDRSAHLALAGRRRDRGALVLPGRRVVARRRKRELDI